MTGGARAISSPLPFADHWNIGDVDRFNEMLASGARYVTIREEFRRRIPEKEIAARYFSKKADPDAPVET